MNRITRIGPTHRGHPSGFTKIISGGQTGADQAALDAAIELGIDHGGWVPKGRLTEAGPLPEKYQLQETPTASYPEQTERNVLDSDGTVIFSRGPLTGGAKLTAELAKKNGKPLIKSVEALAGHKIRSADEASAVIVKEMAQRFRRSHRLRVVK